jgi:hypothetical protein
MADQKISQLTGSTTPLAGTEVLPIVQAGTTVKVAVSNLTAGRSVAMLSNTINANTVVPSAGSITGTNLWAIGADATVNTLLMDSFGSNNFLAFRRSSGTAAAPTAVVSGNSIINFGARGYGATGYSTGNRSSINISAAETWTDTAQGTRMILNVCPIGSTSLTETLKLDPNSDVTVSNGNLVIGTAGKGINFTANTPAAGMTSQLLNWYEEGTWTPNQGAGLTVIGAFSSTGKYTRAGRNLTISGTVTGATSVALAAAGIITTNLPFTVGTAGHGNATNVAINAFAAVICTSTNVTSAGAIGATATITFSATYFV